MRYPLVVDEYRLINLRQFIVYQMHLRIAHFGSVLSLLFVFSFMQGHPPERKIPGKMVVPSDPQREQVLKLIAEKDKIEKKIAELGYTLQKVSLPRISTLLNFFNAIPINF